MALLMVHVGLPFSANIAPLAMFFGGLLLLLEGDGGGSLDAHRRKRSFPRFSAH